MCFQNSNLGSQFIYGRWGLPGVGAHSPPPIFFRTKIDILRYWGPRGAGVGDINLARCPFLGYKSIFLIFNKIYVRGKIFNIDLFLFVRILQYGVGVEGVDINATRRFINLAKYIFCALIH